MTNEWLDSVAARSLGYRETLEVTYDTVCSIVRRGIPGDFVECGVFAGAHCAVMARALMDMHGALLPIELAEVENARRIHLFDSFQGLPAADERDKEIWAHHGAKTGEAACSLEAVRCNMIEWGISASMLSYHPGWFEDTIPEAVSRISFGKFRDGSRVTAYGSCTHENPYSGRLLHQPSRFVCPVCTFSTDIPVSALSQIALLRLDADLYSSTKICVENLYPLVNRGGYVIVDDWNLSGCRQAINETVVPAPICWRLPTK